MQVILNGEARQLEADTSVRALLTQLGLDPAKIAVERNLRIVPRSAYDREALADGDRLEIVTHLIPAFQESNRAVLYLRRRAPEMEAEHAAIRAALGDGDAATAGAVMRAHIARVRRELSQLP